MKNVVESRSLIIRGVGLVLTLIAAGLAVWVMNVASVMARLKGTWTHGLLTGWNFYVLLSLGTDTVCRWMN